MKNHHSVRLPVFTKAYSIEVRLPLFCDRPFASIFLIIYGILYFILFPMYYSLAKKVANAKKAAKRVNEPNGNVGIITLICDEGLMTFWLGPNDFLIRAWWACDESLVGESEGYLWSVPTSCFSLRRSDEVRRMLNSGLFRELFCVTAILLAKLWGRKWKIWSCSKWLNTTFYIFFRQAIIQV